MEKKIVQVYFTPGSTYPGDSPSVWQYDYGQILRIQGLNLPPAVEIHFALQKTGGTSKTRIGITKDGVTDVPIPDSMLENEDETKDYDIYAFVYITDETSGQTEYRITLKVKARPKPEVPGGGDNPDIFHEAVEAVRKAMEAAAESEKQAEGWAHGREDLPERAEDNAKYYAGKAHEDAEQTATDRKEVERLVESVSGIEEQVEKVDELTKQAQKAATDAGLHKEAAENARKGAETAKSEAETAAGKTAEDKTAVETARGEVLKAQEAVSTDRKAVESIKSGIEQLGGEIIGTVEQGMQELGAAKQQAVQAIEQTGAAQKSAVEASGTKAVQSIEKYKQTATEAVEIAKSEAVQAIQTEGTTQTGAVTAEGEKQVQAVRGAAQEIVADRGQIQENKTGIAKLKEDITTQMEAKLDKQQGAENAGKALVVGEDGNVVPQEETTKVEVDSTLTQSGKAADAKATGDKILQFAIKNTVNGESPLVVPDSAEEGILGLKVFGKSTQVQTTGAQLFNAREALASQIEKGIVSFDSDGKIILNGKFDSSNRQFNITLQPGTYTLSGDDNGIWHIIAKNDSVFRQTLVVDVETTYQCYIASNTYNNRVTTPMINIGDSAKPYEPYTGCKPSPSPEFPQEIVSSGDSGNVTVDMNTGNLFDINTVKKYEVDNTTLSLSVSGNKIIFNSKISTGKEAIMNILGKNNDAIKLPLGKYILSYKSNKPFGSTNGTDTVEMYACIRTGDSTVYRSTGTENYVIFEIKEGDELFLRFDINKSGQSAEFYDIMLNRGEIALPYESYFNQSLTLSTPNGLPGIKVDTGGNYTDSTGQQWITDEIDLARGKYIQRIGRKIFDGAENWSHTITEKHKNNNFQMMIENEKGTINHHSVCNYIRFTNLVWDDVLENLPKIYVYDSQITASFPPESEINSLETWKNYLKEKRDFEIQYVFETPTETELTPETIAAFKILHSNYPTTVISNDENAGMEASYVADTKHYIDKKFEELNQAIVNTQAQLL